MKKLRTSYRIIVLFIIVGAFPISIASVSAELAHKDSLICKFLEDENTKLNINCDHCTYFSEDNDIFLFEFPIYISHSKSEFTSYASLNIFPKKFQSYTNRSPPVI